jgi:hypothetical protein
MAAAEMGLRALAGKPEPAYDSLVHGVALGVMHLRHHDSLKTAGDAVPKALQSGAPFHPLSSAINARNRPRVRTKFADTSKLAGRISFLSLVAVR